MLLINKWAYSSSSSSLLKQQNSLIKRQHHISKPKVKKKTTSPLKCYFTSSAGAAPFFGEPFLPPALQMKNNHVAEIVQKDKIRRVKRVYSGRNYQIIQYRTRPAFCTAPFLVHIVFYHLQPLSPISGNCQNNFFAYNKLKRQLQ